MGGVRDHIDRRGPDTRRPKLGGPNIARSVDRQPVELVDALGVLLGPVVADSFGPLPVRPLVHGRSVALERHEGNPVPARIGDPAHLGDDDRAHAHARPTREPTGQIGEGGIVGQDGPALPVQSHDAGRSAECAEHHHDPAILTQVGDGLDATPGLVEVGHGALVDDDEFLPIALGRAVHHAFGREWGGRHEEDRLCLEPVGETLIDDLVRPAHPAIIAAGGCPPARTPCLAGTPPGVTSRG